ncbi:MAG: hypothetical protein Q4C54_01695 [Clostridia bacterium]|nr:hypothetical protein [Clostridia bacterium]
MTNCSVSVRMLVEFSIHGGDILPGGSIKDMQDGMLGHKARQKLLGDGWESEVSLTLDLPEADGIALRVLGRMDAFHDGELPVIEEIKVKKGRGEITLDPAHRAQAVCYGHMLCTQEHIPQVMIRIAYVSVAGTILELFEEILSA